MRVRIRVEPRPNYDWYYIDVKKHWYSRWTQYNCLFSDVDAEQKAKECALRILKAACPQEVTLKDGGQL